MSGWNKKLNSETKVETQYFSDPIAQMRLLAGVFYQTDSKR